jgi:transcriptional regulator with XRE-family HTH domain
MAKYSQVGERLRELREKNLNISQEEFAKRVGISLSGYQNYEAGKRVPHPHALTKIAEMCDTTVDWILTGELNVEKARQIEWLKRASAMEELVEEIERSVKREEKLLVMGVREETPKYGLDRLGQIKDKDLIQTLRNFITDTKIDILQPEDRKVVEDVIEILKSKKTDIVNALIGNIKVFKDAIKGPKEKRAYSRSLLTVPVDFQIIDEPGIQSGLVINGSKMGLLIQTPHDIPVGKKLDLRVSMGKDVEVETFRTKGEVIWKDKRRVDDTEEYQYGVKLFEVLNEKYLKLR